jgi:hypothetical protein
MKIKNKYNIGDYVWVGENAPTRHRIKAIEIFVHLERGTSVAYVLEGVPPEYCGFREAECFLSKAECLNHENYNSVRATATRVNQVFLRLCLIIAMMIIVIPFLIAQAIYWLFTGRCEPLSYRTMDKICMMFNHGKT